MANCQGPVLTLTSNDYNIATLLAANTCFVIIYNLISVTSIAIVTTIIIVIVTIIIIIVVSIFIIILT